MDSHDHRPLPPPQQGRTTPSEAPGGLNVGSLQARPSSEIAPRAASSRSASQHSAGGAVRAGRRGIASTARGVALPPKPDANGKNRLRIALADTLDALRMVRRPPGQGAVATRSRGMPTRRDTRPVSR